MSLFTHLSKRFLNIPVYKGPFVLKKYPSVGKYSQAEFERIYDEISATQQSIVEPSPLHVVRRVVHFYSLNRKEKLICRKLGIHSLHSFDPVVVPNTPHFNRLLWEIKHIINLRPVSFPDGIPSEFDIGRVKLNHFTGELTIADKYKPSEFRLIGHNKNPIYEGHYLREYLKKLVGILQITTRS